MTKQQMIKRILKGNIDVRGREGVNAERYLYNKYNRDEIEVLYKLGVEGEFLDGIKYRGKPVALYTVEEEVALDTYRISNMYEQDVELGYIGSKKQHLKDWIEMYIFALEDDGYYILDDRNIRIWEEI